MVEPEDPGQDADRRGNPGLCLRVKVSNVREYADLLAGQGVEVDFRVHSWGTVAKFFDPDGNLCAFKDDETFERQVESGE